MHRLPVIKNGRVYSSMRLWASNRHFWRAPAPWPRAAQFQKTTRSSIF